MMKLVVLADNNTYFVSSDSQYISQNLRKRRFLDNILAMYGLAF